jgi:hypothetical protein
MSHCSCMHCKSPLLHKATQECCDTCQLLARAATSALLAAGERHREGVLCQVRTIVYGPAEVKEAQTLLQNRRDCKPGAASAFAWTKHLLPAPMLDLLESAEQIRQVRLAVEGVSLRLLSTLPTGGQHNQSTVSRESPVRASEEYMRSHGRSKSPPSNIVRTEARVHVIELCNAASELN